MKFGELCGSSMSFSCKLPSEDLDLLVTITCDEELASVIQEYDRVSSDMKIRALLFPHKSLKKISPPPSPHTASTLKFSPFKPPTTAVSAYQVAYSDMPVYQCHSPAVGFPLGRVQKEAAKFQNKQLYTVPRWNQCL